MAKTLAELGEDWAAYGVSIVGSPAVPKAKWLAIKSQHNDGEDISMGETYLRRQREALRLTQEQVAMKSGVDRSRIAQVETGTRNVTPDMAQKLAPVFKSQPIELQARQLHSKVEAAFKAEKIGKGAIHRTVADLEDLRDSTEDEADKKVLADAIAELKKLAEDEAKPADEDRTEKSQRRPARQGRDAHGKRKKTPADIGAANAATKSNDQPRKRDARGRRR